MHSLLLSHHHYDYHLGCTYYVSAFSPAERDEWVLQLKRGKGL